MAYNAEPRQVVLLMTKVNLFPSQQSNTVQAQQPDEDQALLNTLSQVNRQGEECL